MGWVVVVMGGVWRGWGGGGVVLDGGVVWRGGGGRGECYIFVLSP